MTKKPETPQGPKRWERARLNAEANPESRGAKLYRKRTTLASVVTADPAFGEVPNAQFVLCQSDRFGATTRREYLCTGRCAALHLQLARQDKLSEAELVSLLARVALDHAHADVVGLGTYRSDYLAPLDHAVLKRSVTCRVCGNTINPARVDDLVAPIAATITKTVTVTPPKNRWYVSPDGRMYGAAELHVVELTEEEWIILEGYSTDELRREFALQYGTRLQEA